MSQVIDKSVDFVLKHLDHALTVVFVLAFDGCKLEHHVDIYHDPCGKTPCVQVKVRLDAEAEAYFSRNPGKRFSVDLQHYLDWAGEHVDEAWKIDQEFLKIGSACLPCFWDFPSHIIPSYRQSRRARNLTERMDQLADDLRNKFASDGEEGKLKMYEDIVPELFTNRLPGNGGGVVMYEDIIVNKSSSSKVTPDSGDGKCENDIRSRSSTSKAADDGGDVAMCQDNIVNQPPTNKLAPDGSDEIYKDNSTAADGGIDEGTYAESMVNQQPPGQPSTNNSDGLEGIYNENLVNQLPGQLSTINVLPVGGSEMCEGSTVNQTAQPAPGQPSSGELALHGSDEIPEEVIASPPSPNPGSSRVARLTPVLDKLWNLLVENSNVGYVGLHGDGGAGKTRVLLALVNMFAEFVPESKVIMVTVGENPEIAKIQNDIAQELGLHLDPDIATAQIFFALKREVKCVILLDDVWDKLQLQAIGMPDPRKNPQRFKVVVATRVQSVCTDTQAIIHVEPPSMNESWNEFTTNVSNFFEELLTLRFQPSKEAKMPKL